MEKDMTTTTTKNWAHSIVTRTDSNFKKECLKNIKHICYKE